MNEKETIRFILENSSEPVIKNKVLRAALSDDLEPGSLKDEMKGTFDPSQETYEEYLQRINLERPFNMAHGGRSGFPRGGSVKPLDKEQQKVWNELNPDLEWKNYKGNRGNWRIDWKRKKKILDQTRGLITEDELGRILTEELGQDITKTKIKGNFGAPHGKSGRTQFAKLLNDLLYKGSFGSITSTGAGGGTPRYYKKPSVMDIKKILKADVLGDVRINLLQPNTIKNVIALDKEFKEIYRSGNVPDIEDVLKLNKKMGTKMTEQSAGTATARLAQLYNGHKFKNKELEGIRVNKKAADGMFEIMNNSPFGNPYRNGLYRASMQTIDTALGNKTGTFEGLKKKSKQILIDNKIPIYSPEIKDSKGNVTRKAKPGFNINEIAGVTGSAKSKNVAVSQFIDIMEGNLNQKTLANFQGQLSIARQNIEGDKSLLSSESKRINKLARKLEGQYDVKLPRLADPDALKSLSTAQIKRLESQTLGTGEDLYSRLVKDAERSGYSIKMPKKAITIKEFTELDNKKLLKFFKDSNIPCIKGAGGQCNSIVDYQKGYNKIVKEAAAGKGSVEAIQKLKGFTKAMRGIAGAAKWTGYGLLAEAGFMVPFAIGDYTAGESWKRVLGNATDYGFGPILGQSEQEEFEAALPEGSLAVEGEKAVELGERLTGMREQKVNPGYGRVGFEEKAPAARQKVYDDIFDKFEFNLKPFLSDTPYAQDQWHQGMWDQAHEEAAATRAQIEKEKQKRIDERTERGIIANRNWQSQLASGGIASLNVKR
mgnify:CR=1 FL=1